VEYLKCARFAEHLSELTPSKKKEFHERAEKFREIAEGLKAGDIKVYTDGIVPEEEQKSSEPRAPEGMSGRSSSLTRSMPLPGSDQGRRRGMSAVW